MKYLQNLIETLEIQKHRTLAEYLREISNRPIYIYGAGCFGREIYRVFKQHNLTVHGFLDKNAGNIVGIDINVMFPEELLNKSEVQIILGIVMNKQDRMQLEDALRKLGYKYIIDGQSIRAHYVYHQDGCCEEEIEKCLKKELSLVKDAFALWEDQESRDTFEKNLGAHILRNYADCYQTDEIKQYFVEGIALEKGYARFIDCGAYIGDTLEELVRTNRMVQCVAAFEPSCQNFMKLNDKYELELKSKINEAVFFPCGVAGKTELRRFNFAGGSSLLESSGRDIVQCVAIDDVLKDFRPTFIKMDIEGAEYEALLGAKKSICKFKPDLAISVYHFIDHFYKIPLLIHSWDLGYKFYLRTHSSCCMETVMYAVAGKED